MSDIDETANVESQAADIQEVTAAEVDTQQDAQETDANQSEEESTEEAESNAEDPEEESGDNSAKEGEESDQPVKTKEDYIRERQERRAEKNALRQAQDRFVEGIDPEDALQRLEAIENDRFIEKVENNINNARRDTLDAQNLPVFKEDPELFVEVMREVAETYGVWHDELKEEDGSPAFLGFYNPKTGQPISILEVAQRQANRLSKVAERVKTSAQVKASQDEAKMRARADNPVSGKNEAPAFDAMSPKEMRDNLLKRGYDIK